MHTVRRARTGDVAWLGIVVVVLGTVQVRGQSEPGWYSGGNGVSCDVSCGAAGLVCIEQRAGVTVYGCVRILLPVGKIT